MPIASPETNNSTLAINRGEPLLINIRRDAESDGQMQTHVEQRLPHGEYPVVTPRFGTLSEFVYNERNSKESWLSTLYIDTNDLYVPINRKLIGELGGEGIYEQEDTLDATGGVPALPANALLLIQSEIRDKKDRAHAIRVSTYVTEWVELLTVVNESPEAGGNKLQISEQVVAPNTVLPTDSTIIKAELKDIDSEKSLKRIISAPNGFGTLNTVNKIDSEAFGVQTTRAETQVDTGTAVPTPTYLTVGLTQQDLGNGKSRLVTTSVASWPTYVDQEEEHETGLEVLVTRQILDRAALPTITKGVARSWKTLKNLDNYKALYVNRVIDAAVLSTTFYEYHPVQYYFPAYLDPASPFYVLNAGLKSVIAVNKSSDHSFSIPCRFEITYHASVPSINEVFQFKPVDLNLISPDWRLEERNVLMDAGTLQFRHYYEDGMGGTSYVDVSYAIPASDPTATEYLADMGTEVLIADDVTRWKFNLWRRTKVFMTLPDISLGLSGYLTY